MRSSAKEHFGFRHKLWAGVHLIPSVFLPLSDLHDLISFYKWTTGKPSFISTKKHLGHCIRWLKLRRGILGLRTTSTGHPHPMWNSEKALGFWGFEVWIFLGSQALLSPCRMGRSRISMCLSANGFWDHWQTPAPEMRKRGSFTEIMPQLLWAKCQVFWTTWCKHSHAYSWLLENPDFVMFGIEYLFVEPYPYLIQMAWFHHEAINLLGDSLIGLT